MSSKRIRLGLFMILGLVICALGGYFALSGPHLAEEGTETEVTPGRYLAMRLRWAFGGPKHYRLVARYHYDIVGGCSEDVEVWNERVIRTYRTDCGHPGFLTVSKIFDMFDDFVGHKRTRPVASNQCMYNYVTAIFDRSTGYPRYMKNHLDWAPTRGRYISLDQRTGTYSCLTIGPPILTATIESLTPLD